MKIFFTTRFRRSYKRLVSKSDKLRVLVKKHITIFGKDPKENSLKNHALKGKFKGYSSFSIGYDLRVIYRKEKSTYIFFDIGTHKNVYGSD